MKQTSISLSQECPSCTQKVVSRPLTETQSVATDPQTYTQSVANSVGTYTQSVASCLLTMTQSVANSVGTYTQSVASCLLTMTQSVANSVGTYTQSVASCLLTMTQSVAKTPNGSTNLYPNPKDIQHKMTPCPQIFNNLVVNSLFALNKLVSQFGGHLAPQGKLTETSLRSVPLGSGSLQITQLP